MLYFLLICFIFILAFSLFSIIRTIRNINKQIKQQRKIRVSLSNRDIEELAYAINQKDNLHKKLQVQIKQEEEQLKQSISNISHDLRTPLTSIQGYLTLLQECEDKQEQGQCIKIIKAKTDYLTDLVQEFYDLSVIENEQVDVECERVDINRIVTDCLIEKPFAKEEELRAKTARLDELNILLNMDKKENEIVGGEPDEGEPVGGRKEKSYER